MENENKQLVLSVKDLAVSFKTDAGLVHAVRGVSFDLFKGETLCIVGESGSGKSVTSKTIMGILSANAVIENGSVIYEGEDLTKIDESEFHRIRGHKIGMVFQDPLSSLNPIMKVGKQITEAMLVNSDLMKQKYDRIISKEEAAYKNIEAKRKTAYQRADRLIENSDEDYNKQIYALESKIKEAYYKASTINPRKKEM
ncbi:MAG: ATP-binding cassette domain-containing protein, partial [Bacilli bacterium]|nr:ATP-binding cassette domain-containing protein [Bacilli bacterium]